MKIPLPLAGASRHRDPVVVGIDLGTTNSLVAVMRDGESRVLAGPDGRTLVPSVVHYAEDGSVLVGESALPWLTAAPERTLFSVKRLMGRGLADVADERKHLPYLLSNEHPEVVRIRLGERVVSPPEVSAQILRELKQRAEAALGEEVSQAVITVPAYFNDSQRQATRDAGRIAGLEVLRIVNEPTAACLAYGLDRRREGRMAVYDLGGGTFDISILKLTDGIFEVLATHGDTHLGGDDFDRAIADWFQRETGAAPGTPQEQAALRAAARDAKHALTAAETAEVRLTLAGEERAAPLSRTRFEELIAPLVERTLSSCRAALADAGLEAAAVDEVVLVGGATRVPLVRRWVAELFGVEPHSSLNPDEVVALGAGVQAGILSGQVQGLLLLDVNPLSLGIETYGGAVERLIPRNSTIPTSARNVFTTGVEGQTAIDIHVVQGERELAADCRSLARFQIHIPPLPAGWPRLEVTFLVDENGILSVSAYEHRSEAEARIEVRPSHGLTDDEVERMVMESFEHAEEDLATRRLVEARVEADQVLKATDKQLPLADQFVTEGLMSPEERARLDQALENLEALADSEDAALIRRRIEELDVASRKLAALVMDRAVQHALQGKSLAETS